MCGILGAVLFQDSQIDRVHFQSSLMSLKHRGPDNQESKFFNNDKIAFGHARLSIIDLSNSANQPFDLGKYSIVYNGEIFNYIEIREELKRHGYKFNTNSDTEVIINAYDFWGVDCVTKFNGMWAFSILNLENYSLFCSRDRFGIKPFNYVYDDSMFVFSSEIKAIINYNTKFCKPNFNSIGLFCREGMSGELRETFFESVYRLEPGHNLFLDGKELTIEKYYDYTNEEKSITTDEAQARFKQLFADSVKLRMRSDVKIGATLSGGLDSTSILAEIRSKSDADIETFTACFSNYEFDESHVASKTNSFYRVNGNYVQVINDYDLIEKLSLVICHLESGNLSPSILPLWDVYELAKDKVKVVLEGQGADELMGGYINSFAGPFLIDEFLKGRLLSFFRNAVQLAKNYSIINILILTFRTLLPPNIRMLVRRYVIRNEGIFLGNIKYVKYPSDVKPIGRKGFVGVLQKSHRTTLSNLLHYGDAISMAFSIESRLPFMDYRLVDFIYSLPNRYFISNGKGKFIMRESLKDQLPAYINSDTKKLGFPSPIGDLLEKNKTKIEEFLLDSRTLNRGLFSEKKLKELLKVNFCNQSNASRLVFRLLTVEIWFRVFVDKNMDAN